MRDLASEIEWAKVSLVTADDYAKAAAATDRPGPGGVDPQSVARLMAAYESAKDQQGVIDFEDVLLLLAAMLAERRDVADSVREQYQHFVVDEYQDVSPLQQYLLDQWLGGRQELCVVGDPSQTIYSFAGATAHHLTSFTATYPRATTVELVRDYRSTPQVVGLANHVMDAARKAGGPAPLALRAQRPDGPDVSYVAYPDDDAEAAGVVQGIADLVRRGVSPADIAVLFRTNVQSEAFEAALADRGIAYQVRGNARFFARADVRKAHGAAARRRAGRRPGGADARVGAGHPAQRRLDRLAAGGPRRRPRALGRAAGPGLARRLARRGAARRAGSSRRCRTSSRSSTSGPPPSTRRPSRA